MKIILRHVLSTVFKFVELLFLFLFSCFNEFSYQLKVVGKPSEGTTHDFGAFLCRTRLQTMSVLTRKVRKPLTIHAITINAVSDEIV